MKELRHWIAAKEYYIIWPLGVARKAFQILIYIK